MKLGGLVDLTYCSNIHPGERWQEVSDNLTASLPRVRDLLSSPGPFGIGLRLSAEAAKQLDTKASLDRFREFLRAGNFYVPTINGFPYGAFHGTRVKERVYLPDWRTPERVAYTNRLARLLAALSVDSGRREASISTVPGAFRTEIRGQSDVDAIADGMLRHVAYLKRLQAESGVTIALAVEPEPACHLETVDELVAFFEESLLDDARLTAVGRETGITLTAADVSRHIGACLDVCHMAVEFEDVPSAIRRLATAGISIPKVQLSSALRLTAGTAAVPAALLKRFAEETYLHQVVVRRAGQLARFSDLPVALGATGSERLESDDEWRVHFHVPIFLDRMQGFGTTQSYLGDVLDLFKSDPFSRCLEVETYTWEVLPAEYRTSEVSVAIAREMAWVLDRVRRP
jgi:sugar phosphate isomerase/epimerase